jgi:hypothetical protein
MRGRAPFLRNAPKLFCVIAVIGPLGLLIAAASPPEARKPDMPAPSRYDYHYSRDEADETMAEFARCLVGSRHLRPQAERYLRAIPTGRNFNAAGVRLSTPDCLPHAFWSIRMRFRPGLLRSALFSALYQRDYGGSPPGDVKSVPRLVIAAEFDGPEADIPADVVFSRVVGDCVARADPADVHALLMTKVASGGEKEALARVVPQLAACLPAGRQMAFSRPVLRGLLAEALYKLRGASTAPATAAAGGH